MNNFSIFLNKKTNSLGNIRRFANDLYLIHQAFYAFLGNSYQKNHIQEHFDILQDELGLTERGQTKKYGTISHAELWLKDLKVDISDIKMIPSHEITPFIRLCYTTWQDSEKSEAFVAAVEGIAEDFVNSLGVALKASGFEELLSVYVHCDPEVGIEVSHMKETIKFKQGQYYQEYTEIVTNVFCSLASHFD
jgi:uncharacterized protein YjaZ